MRTFLEKLKTLERVISDEKGPFVFFALFLREDAPGVWDLLVCAPWIEQDKGAALRYLTAELNKLATPEELTMLSRVVLIDASNPALPSIQKAIRVEHGEVEVTNSNFFGLSIKQAFIITSRRANPKPVLEAK